MTVGRYLMTDVLEWYALLKAAGKEQDLDEMRKMRRRVLPADCLDPGSTHAGRSIRPPSPHERRAPHDGAIHFALVMSCASA